MITHEAASSLDAAASQQPIGYGALADDLVATGVLSDPWLDGEPRFEPADKRNKRPFG